MASQKRETAWVSFATRDAVAQHDHAMLVYDSDRELVSALGRFLHEGRVSQEVTTFVHSYASDQDARSAVSALVADAELAEAVPDFLLAHYAPAFERGGRIDHIHAAQVVAALSNEARALGRAGTRIFVDASKDYIDTPRESEWIAFESWLGPHLQLNTTLICTYAGSQLEDPDVLAPQIATNASRLESRLIPAR